MRFLKALLLFCAAQAVYGASWYVDSAATGSKNGTSWANAWTNCSDVVWGGAGVTAGDTLYLSGGTTSKEIYGAITVGTSGTPASPITIRVGQDAGHNGKAVIPGISINSRTNIIINGAKSDAFTAPTSVLNIEAMTNNIGIQVTRTNYFGIQVSGAGGRDNAIRWVEVGPLGTTNNVGDVHGIQFLATDVMTGWEISHCWVHDIQNDGITMFGATTQPQEFDAMKIDWCLVELTGDDGIQVTANGVTVSHCFLRDQHPTIYNGHPDQLQFSGQSSKYLKAVNNIMRNKGNSLIIGEHYVTEGSVLGPMLIAGNLFYGTRDFKYITNSPGQAYGTTFDAWRPNTATNVTACSWSNLYVLNNTWYYQKTEPFKVGRASPSGGTRSAWRIDITNSAVRNNLMVDCKWNTAAPSAFNVTGTGDPGALTNGIFYTTNAVPMTHNVVAGPNKQVAYHAVAYTTGESLGMANVSTMPALTDTNTYDFRLTTTDTVSRDNGYDLSALTNDFPELMVDLWGNSRGYGDGWDIGASEASPDATLIVQLKFEDDLTDGIADDSTASGNHGYRYGHQANPTNWPTSITWTNPITAGTNAAAHFQWYPTNGWGLYSKSGDYIAITNITGGGLQNLTAMTAMLWVRRDPAPDGDGDGNQEWADDQGRYLCSGFGYSGAWSVGMFSDQGNPYSYVRIYTNNSAGSDTYLWFGEDSRVSTTPGEQGALDWQHLAFTWNSGALTTYINGTNVASTTLPITALTVRGVGGSTTDCWLAIGCDTHNGNPYLTPEDDSGDQYPNHAWFAGDLEDIRIYNRALSSNEIQAVYGHAWAPTVQVSKVNAAYTSAGIVAYPGYTTPVPLLVQEGFEGTGYELSWVATGSNDPDSTANVIEGSQSLLQDASSAVSHILYTTAENEDEIWVFAAFRMSNLSATRTLFVVRDSAGTQLGYVNVTSTKVYAGASGPANEASFTVSANTWYYGWMHYKVSSGASNGACDFSISATTTKPVTPTVVEDAHNLTAKVRKVTIGSTGNTGLTRTFDNIVISDTVIGSAP